MFLHVVGVRPLADYTLRVEFSDGTVREADLRNERYGEMFEPLRERELFAAVRVNPGTRTVEWPNGADFAPEFLAETGREIARAA